MLIYNNPTCEKASLVRDTLQLEIANLQETVSADGAQDYKTLEAYKETLQGAVASCDYVLALDNEFLKTPDFPKLLESLYKTISKRPREINENYLNGIRVLSEELRDVNPAADFDLGAAIRAHVYSTPRHGPVNVYAGQYAGQGVDQVNGHGPGHSEGGTDIFAGNKKEGEGIQINWSEGPGYKIFRGNMAFGCKVQVNGNPGMLLEYLEEKSRRKE